MLFWKVKLRIRKWHQGYERFDFERVAMTLEQYKPVAVIAEGIAWLKGEVESEKAQLTSLTTISLRDRIAEYF